MAENISVNACWLSYPDASAMSMMGWLEKTSSLAASVSCLRLT